jgi:hypothetical protein
VQLQSAEEEVKQRPQQIAAFVHSTELVQAYWAGQEPFISRQLSQAAAASGGTTIPALPHVRPHSLAQLAVAHAISGAGVSVAPGRWSCQHRAWHAQSPAAQAPAHWK